MLCLQLYDRSRPIHLTENFNQQCPESSPAWRDLAQQPLTSPSAQHSIIFTELQWRKDTQVEPCIDHSSSLAVGASGTGMGRPNPVQTDQICLSWMPFPCIFFSPFFVFPGLSNSLMLATSGTFPSSSLNCSFLLLPVNACEEVPAHVNSQPSSTTDFITVQFSSLGPDLLYTKVIIAYICSRKKKN